MPGNLEALLAVAQAAQDDAEPDDAVADDHDHRKTVSRASVGLAFARQHDRQDQGDLDHGDGDGEHQRAVRLAGAMGDDVGMMHAGEHHAHQHHKFDDRQG